MGELYKKRGQIKRTFTGFMKKIAVFILSISILLSGCASKEPDFLSGGMQEINEGSMDFEKNQSISGSDDKKGADGNYTIRTEYYTSQVMNSRDRICAAYPQVAGMGDKEKEKEINDLILNDLIEGELGSEAAAFLNCDVYQLNLEYEITLQSPEVLSILYQGTSRRMFLPDPENNYRNNSNIHTITIDLVNAKKLELTDFTEINETFLKWIKQSVEYDKSPLYEAGILTKKELRERIVRVDENLPELINNAYYYTYCITPDTFIISVGDKESDQNYELIEVPREEHLNGECIHTDAEMHKPYMIMAQTYDGIADKEVNVIKYPQIAGMRDKEKEKAINRLILTDLEENEIGLYAQDLYGWDCMYHLDFLVIMRTPEILSILYEGESQNGYELEVSSHVHGITIDLVNAEKMELEDFIKIEDEFTKRLIESEDFMETLLEKGEITREKVRERIADAYYDLEGLTGKEDDYTFCAAPGTLLISFKIDFAPLLAEDFILIEVPMSYGIDKSREKDAEELFISEEEAVRLLLQEVYPETGNELFESIAEKDPEVPEGYQKPLHIYEWNPGQEDKYDYTERIDSYGMTEGYYYFDMYGGTYIYDAKQDRMRFVYSSYYAYRYVVNGTTGRICRFVMRIDKSEGEIRRL